MKLGRNSSYKPPGASYTAHGPQKQPEIRKSADPLDRRARGRWDIPSVAAVLCVSGLRSLIPGLGSAQVPGILDPGFWFLDLGSGSKGLKL